jgi:transposase
MTNHKNLIDQIELQGVSRVKLANALGVHYMTIYRWYNADSIKPINLRRLEKALADVKTINMPKLNRYNTAELLNELKRRGLTITIK